MAGASVPSFAAFILFIPATGLDGFAMAGGGGVLLTFLFFCLRVGLWLVFLFANMLVLIFFLSIAVGAADMVADTSACSFLLRGSLDLRFA